MKFHRLTYHLIYLALLSASIVVLPLSSAHARSGGITGYSGNPAIRAGASCTSCHSGGATPSVRINGPTSVTPGSTNAYTLTISGGESVFGSLDVSASGGTLVNTSGDTKLLNNEIVHIAEKSVDGAGNVSFTFSWTAPAAAGNQTLYGAGLSSTGNGTDVSMSSTASLAIAVAAPQPVNQAPTASAGGPYSGTAGLAIAFDGSGSRDADGSIVSYSWSFGDGSSATGAQASHAYAAAGSYNASLTVKDDKGASAVANFAVQVIPAPIPNQAPVANAGGPYSGISGIAIAFDGSGSSDSDGSIVSYSWDFGDSTNASGPQASHAYLIAGTFTVKLTVTDDDGASSTAMAQVQVSAPAQNQAPTANAGGPYNAFAGEIVSFDGSLSRDSDGSIVSYSWSFGDGAVANGPRASHAYASAGSFTATLKVVDDKGASSEASALVQIQAVPVPNQAPVAHAGGPYSGIAGSAIAFDGSGSSDSDGSISSFSWDFGDGSSASGAQASHAYAAAGSYNALLTVTDNEGASAQASIVVNVTAAPSDGGGDGGGGGGETPAPMPVLKAKIQVPLFVFVSRSHGKAVKIRLAAKAPSANAPCVMANLQRNRKAFDSQQVCVSMQNGVPVYMASFDVQISAADAGILLWGGNFNFEGTVSKTAIAPMLVWRFGR